jgi:hypothetical protein
MSEKAAVNVVTELVEERGDDSLSKYQPQTHYVMNKARDLCARIRHQAKVKQREERKRILLERYVGMGCPWSFPCFFSSTFLVGTVNDLPSSLTHFLLPQHTQTYVWIRQKARDLARQAAESAREDEAREAALRLHAQKEVTKAARQEQELTGKQLHEDMAECSHASDQHHGHRTLSVWGKHAHASTRDQQRLQAVGSQVDMFYATPFAAREALHQRQASMQQTKAFQQEERDKEGRLIQAAKMERLREGVLLVRFLRALKWGKDKKRREGPLVSTSIFSDTDQSWWCMRESSEHTYNIHSVMHTDSLRFISHTNAQKQWDRWVVQRAIFIWYVKAQHMGKLQQQHQHQHQQKKKQQQGRDETKARVAAAAAATFALSFSSFAGWAVDAGKWLKWQVDRACAPPRRPQSPSHYLDEC